MLNLRRHVNQTIVKKPLYRFAVNLFIKLYKCAANNEEAEVRMKRWSAGKHTEGAHIIITFANVETPRSFRSPTLWDLLVPRAINPSRDNMKTRSKREPRTRPT